MIAYAASPAAEGLRLAVHGSRSAMGENAARLVHDEIARVVAARGRARMVMACAPSQSEYYAALVPLALAAPDVWRRVELYHMDDYVGLDADHPQSFRHYLREHFLKHVEVARFEPLRGEAPDPDAEARRYGESLAAAPIDVISLGIGENGHIAFNDPPVADFADPLRVKVVEMDQACRRQQVNDGCFPAIADVPRHALSITLPVFASAGLLCCIVPGERKAPAVRDSLVGPIGPACPATLLRTHPRAWLFTDEAAASLVPGAVRAALA